MSLGRSAAAVAALQHPKRPAARSHLTTLPVHQLGTQRLEHVLFAICATSKRPEALQSLHTLHKAQAGSQDGAYQLQGRLTPVRQQISAQRSARRDKDHALPRWVAHQEARLYLTPADRETLTKFVLLRPSFWVVQVVRRDPQCLRRPGLRHLRLGRINIFRGQPARAKRTQRTPRGSDKWPQKL